MELKNLTHKLLFSSTPVVNEKYFEETTDNGQYEYRVYAKEKRIPREEGGVIVGSDVYAVMVKRGSEPSLPDPDLQYQGVFGIVSKIIDTGSYAGQVTIEIPTPTSHNPFYKMKVIVYQGELSYNQASNNNVLPSYYWDDIVAENCNPINDAANVYAPGVYTFNVAANSKIVLFIENTNSAPKPANLGNTKVSWSVIDHQETVIEEPSGFDNFQDKIKRNDYSGMSASFSDVSLGFHGVAVPFIDSAYNMDIDSIVEYHVQASDGTYLYKGALDLSTYSKQLFPYEIVNCKVGEIGVKTTFNNRVKTEVDLNTAKTVDGEYLTHTHNWQNILIPQKKLCYTNRLNQYKDSGVTEKAFSNGVYMFFMLDDDSVREFGSVGSGNECKFSSVAPPFADENMAFMEDEDFDEKFGADTTMHVSGKLKFKIDIVQSNSDGLTTVPTVFEIGLFNASGTRLAGREVQYSVWTSDSQRYYREFDEPYANNYNIDCQTSGKLFLVAHIHKKNVTHLTVNYSMKVVIEKGSWITMKMYDNLVRTDVSANMMLVHDAINKITEAVSENGLTVKSDFYAHKTSAANPSADAPGYGALKAITNGYKIRGLFTDSTTERNMPLSFSNMIKSLNMLDCIGWGFSNENGVEYIRVEPWNWFYKNTVLLTITDAEKVDVSLEPDDVPTSLQLGYKKYTTSSEYDSIDSVHSERTFISKIKAVSNEISSVCEFIADNYAIEEMRRAKYNVDPSEECKYDENIFVFELEDGRLNSATTTENFAVAKSASDVSNIPVPSEFINAKLSPRWCAERWKSYLFRAISQSALKFSTGKVNYKASYKVAAYSSSPGGDYYKVYGLLPDSTLNYLTTITPKTAENADIANTHCILDAETIEFEYPISLAQYQTIKANPYGMISVNGRSGWIKEFTYKLVTGMATFKLIAAHTFPSNS